MCKLCDNIKYNFSTTDGYNTYIEEIENNFDFTSIGKIYEYTESDWLHFFSIPPKRHKFRVINLYKYEPQPGYSPIMGNTRRFCSQLYLRTKDEKNFLTYDEIQRLSNPGAKYGVSDILRFCGNYTTNLSYTTCRHRWIRYKYDTESGNIIKDVKQPLYSKSIS